MEKILKTKESYSDIGLVVSQNFLCLLSIAKASPMFQMSLSRFVEIYADFLKRFKENKQNTTDNVLEKIRRVDNKFRLYFYEQISGMFDDDSRRLYAFNLA